MGMTFWLPQARAALALSKAVRGLGKEESRGGEVLWSMPHVDHNRDLLALKGFRPT
jgi:hypothetical protein